MKSYTVFVPPSRRKGQKNATGDENLVLGLELEHIIASKPNLIDAKLVQLYHLPPEDYKRKRSDNESDHNDQNKLASEEENYGIVQDNQNDQDDQDAQDPPHVFLSS
ncbi:hypothetical protein PENFLA_c019G06262 [Penicillium flavigenum]|uniref:Uncharacterized protein n=1 Tax=Penicillium flavigenum TaxID=254877 RepID=A0A1V6SYV9_9EURO|nr:hypothetical protein PENFLA_c019G06262 [Penicillium flavigenum]